MSKQKSAPDGVVMGSDDSSRVRWYQKPALRFSVIGVIALVLLVGGGALILGILQNNDRTNVVLDANMPRDYAVLTSQEAAELLEFNTGLKVEELEKSSINSRTFKNYDHAYQAAQALAVRGSQDKALDAYAVAAKKAPKDVGSEFYMKYAAVADRNDKTDLYKELIAKARSVIENNPKLSEQEKAAALVDFDYKQQIRKLGY